jgi:DNA-binding SARP family transcriptional activator
MHIEPEHVDLTHFRALTDRGRSAVSDGRCAEASEYFRQALALWRGTALADLTHTGMLAHYALRLDEERLTSWQERIGADICQGRSAEVIGELEELCARYPLRESFYEQLMHALYHSDRRAEALKVYTRAHQVMVENVGIEPGPGLRAVQQAILSGRSLPGGRHAGHRSGVG